MVNAESPLDVSCFGYLGPSQPSCTDSLHQPTRRCWPRHRPWHHPCHHPCSHLCHYTKGNLCHHPCHYLCHHPCQQPWAHPWDWLFSIISTRKAMQFCLLTLWTLQSIKSGVAINALVSTFAIFNNPNFLHGYHMAESESSLSTIGTWIGKWCGLQIGELAIGALPPCEWRTFACGCCSKLLTCGRQQVQIHIHKYKNKYKYAPKYKYKFAYGCCSKLPMCGQEQVQKRIHTPK